MKRIPMAILTLALVAVLTSPVATHAQDRAKEYDTKKAATKPAVTKKAKTSLAGKKSPTSSANLSGRLMRKGEKDGQYFVSVEIVSSTDEAKQSVTFSGEQFRKQFEQLEVGDTIDISLGSTDRKAKSSKKGGSKKKLQTKKALDVEAIEASIQAAVEAGKLTQEEAEAKMAFIKDRGGEGRSKKQARTREPFLPLGADAIAELHSTSGLTTPTAAAVREGSDSTFIFGWAANATHRFMDFSHAGKARMIRGVSFRLDQREHDASGRTWSNVTVRVGHADWDSIQYNQSPEFTLVDTPVKVFDQEWSFPAVKGTPPLTPASWGGLQNSLTFRFSEPWRYNGKDALFLEFQFSGGTAHNGTPWEGQTPDGFEYYLDSMPEDGGWREDRKASAINYAASIVPAATSYAAGANPTEMSVWTSSPKGMAFIHYHE